MATIQMFFPSWRNMSIHEGSPANRSTSIKLREAKSYVASQYDRSIPFGSTHAEGGYRSEDLENQTFPDENFDLVVTQDVFEHLFDPAKAIAEIARTLKPNGVYVMSVPIICKDKPSRRRAAMVNGEVKTYFPEEWHGNPIDPKNGSLVTIDWGYDILDFIQAHSGMTSSLVYFDDLHRGLRAQLMDIIVARKSSSPVL